MNSLTPASYRVEYRAAASDAPSARRVIDVEGFDSYVTQELSLLVRFDGERLDIEAVPHVPLVLERVLVRFSHAYAQRESVLHNGYQSWTTTAWRSVWRSMRGLETAPRPIVKTYALDAIGDYRFAEYKMNSSRQHGYTYAVLREEGDHVLVASLDETRGFTRIETDASAGTLTMETECPARELPEGETVAVASYAVVAGAEAAVYDRWFALSGIQARPVRPLVGYSSWYRHYGEIDQDKLGVDLEGAQRAFGTMPGQPGFAVEGATLLFQVDDGYCKVGDWLDVNAAKFPDGLPALARRIRSAGFLPGLWLAPFVCERESRVFARHPDWVLRDDAGDPVRTGFHWSGHYALDTLNPDVRAHVASCVRTIVHEWGFGLLKLDFLYGACLEPHGGMNRGELMADALRLVRQAAGEECLLLGCGMPLASGFGLVDYCRIGCDVGLDWDGPLYLRPLHSERVSTKNSLGDTIARAPLDGRAFGNDPDVFFLRDDVKLSERQRRRLLETDARLGSMLLTSDNMGEWDSEQRAQFQDAVRVLVGRKAPR